MRRWSSAALGLVAWLLSGHTVAQTTGESKFGGYLESASDLAVKVQGGAVEMRRTYGKAGGWVFNDQWADLQPVDADGKPIAAGQPFTSLKLFEMTYTWDGTSYRAPAAIPAGTICADAADTGAGHYGRIDSTGTPSAPAYRWYDLEGNFVDFTGFRATAFGNARGIVGTLVRDAAGRLTGVQDVHGTTVATLEYQGTTSLVTRIADYSGREVLYAYTSGQLTSVTDVRGKTWQYQYAGGVLTRKINPKGEATTIGRRNGRVSSIRDADGIGVDYVFSNDSQTQLFYTRLVGGNNLIAETWTDHTGVPVRRDLNGRTIEKVSADCSDLLVTDEHKNVTRIRRDRLGRPSGVDYPDGARVRLEYATSYWQRPGEAFGISALVDENGVRTEFTRDAKGKPLTMRQAVGTPEEREWRLTYRPSGLIESATQFVNGDFSDPTELWTYDAYGNVATYTDAEGRQQSFLYNVMGQVTRVTDGRGKSWNFTYDPAGNLLTATDPLSNQRTYTYDDAGFLVTAKDEEDHTTSYAVNQRGRVTQVTSPLGDITRFTYDAADRLTTVTDALGHIASYGYDRDGRIVSAREGGVTATFEYFAGQTPENPGNGPVVKALVAGRRFEAHHDARGRVVLRSILGNDGRRWDWRMAYDGVGRATRIETPGGVATRLAYDALGRETERTMPDGAVLRFAYALWDERMTLTDPADQTTTFDYDRAGLLVEERLAQSNPIHFTYDDAGYPTVVTDARGQRFEKEYDDAGRLTAVRAFAAGATDPTRTLTYGYDRRGLLTQHSDGTTSGVLQYDAVGRLLSQTTDYGSFTKSDSYTYFANGLRKSWTSPDGVETSYGYDGDDRLVSMQIPGSGSIAFSDFDGAAPTTITYPGGVTRTVVYDEAGQVSSIRVVDGAGNEILRRDYTRAPSGDVLERATEHGVYTYTYNQALRLMTADNPDLPDEAYVYDGVGNRSPPGAPWTYGPDNQLEQAGPVGFTHDLQGNRTAETGPTPRSFEYDELDRLVHVRDGSGATIARYGYDALGRRAWKEVGGTRTYFQYNDEGLAAELDASGNARQVYGFVPGSQWSTDPLFLREGDALYVSHNDELGTPQALTNPAGGVAWSAQYTAFGAAQVQQASVQQPFRFPGQTYDAETGFHQNGMRDYDPATGRYLERDPLGWLAGMNRFAYAAGNPLNAYDPLGGDVCWSSVGRNVVVGAAVGAAFVVGGAVVIGAAAGGAAAAAVALGASAAAAATVGGAVGTGLGLGLGAYGLYQLGSEAYALSGGYDPATGRALSEQEIADRAGALAGGLVGGGLAGGKYGRSLYGLGGRFANWAFNAARSLLGRFRIPCPRPGPVPGGPGPGRGSGGADDGVGTPAPGGSPGVPPGLPRPPGVPEEWVVKPSKKGGGTRYTDPTNPHNSVRVMPGDKNSPFPNSREPYVRWQKDGQALDASGNPVGKNTPEAHIPYPIFKFKPDVYKKN